MEFTKLCLVLTDRCTAACDFCGFSCSPDNHQVMDADLMKRMICEAKAMGMHTVSFSGGEPFLYPQLLEEGVRTARENRLAVNIATNGFWGAWDDDRIRETLKRIRPDSMGISYDSFHQKFVPEEIFFRAFRSCMASDIETRVYVADMKDERSAGRFLMNLGNSRFSVPLGFYPVYRCGRALNLPQEWFLTSKYKDENLGCLSESTLSVLYNGDVYPCCKHQVYESAMKLGNVKEQSLRQALDISDVPRICDILARDDRFRRLLDKAEEMGIEIPQEGGCSCDYCRVLFGTRERMQMMMPYAEEIYGEMLVRSLLKGAGAQ